MPHAVMQHASGVVCCSQAVLVAWSECITETKLMCLGCQATGSFNVVGGGAVGAGARTFWLADEVVLPKHTGTSMP